MRCAERAEDAAPGCGSGRGLREAAPVCGPAARGASKTDPRCAACLPCISDGQAGSKHRRYLLAGRL